MLSQTVFSIELNDCHSIGLATVKGDALWSAMVYGALKLEVRPANDNNELSNARSPSWKALTRILIWMNAVRLRASEPQASLLMLSLRCWATIAQLFFVS